ncbi:hypothetical protein MMC11_008028 [Xylographa trunciseda]|nr:hypothetical protein [Xylographa trunciseda]
MPTKARKKAAARRIYETIDRPKQTYFTPQNRTILNRNPSLSAPTSWQQTLTQIDFVSRLPHEDEDLDLEYLQEEMPRAKKRQRTVAASTDQDEDATYEEQVPLKRKRRKTAPAAIEKDSNVSHLQDQASPVRPKRTSASRAVLAPKVKTGPRKRIAKKATKSVQGEAEETASHHEKPPTSPQARSRRSSEIMMPPPRTPKTVKTEIPSSQSPGNTPLSMHSRRSTRNDSRSPLKEKSNNRRMTKPLDAEGGISVHWTPRLEVKDTFEGDPSSPVKIKSIPRVPKLVIRDTLDPSSEGSDLSTITQSSRTGTISQSKTGVQDPDFPILDTISASVPPDSIQSRSSSMQDTSTPTLETILPDQSARSEMLESDVNHREEQRGEDVFDIGLDTQAALDNAQTLPPDTNLEPEQIPNIVEDFNNAMRAAAQDFSTAPSKPNSRNMAPHPTTAYHRPKYTATILTPRTPLSKRRENNYRCQATTQVPRTPPPRLSDSEQASAQLTTELLRQIQQPTNPIPSKTPLSKPPPRHSSTPILIEDDSESDSPAIEQRSRPLEPTSSHPSSSANQPPTLHSQRYPVPFSQATTVDATQSSPRASYTQVPSSPQAPSLPHHLQPAILGISPTARLSAMPTVIPSSPSDSVAELSSQSQPLWDGKPPTDSQLLPDSLMDMTVPRPPWGLSQESLVEE